MEFITVTLVLLAMIGVMVIAHEWGHFIVARIFKMRVDDFSIGFGPRLIRIAKVGDTEYNIRAFPLGGFVKIAGMSADEEPLVKARKSLEAHTSPSATPEQAAEAANPEDTSDLFSSRPIWQRSLVILAGPVMSFVFGVMVFCLAGCTVGIPGSAVTTRIASASPGGAAYSIGLRSGDIIDAVNHQPVKTGDELAGILQRNFHHPLTLTVNRGEKVLTVIGTPQQYVDDDGNPLYAQTVVKPNSLKESGLKPGDVINQIGDSNVTGSVQMFRLLLDSVGKKTAMNLWRNNNDVTIDINLQPAQLSHLPTVKDFPIGMLKVSLELAIVHVPFTESIGFGFRVTRSIFQNLAEMFQQRHASQLKNSTGGIVMMYNLTGLAVKLGVSQVVLLAGQLSISLAIFNILPIPVLDGGHLLSYFIEWIRRGQKMSEKQQQAFLLTGMAVIGVLFMLIFTNDIHKVITHQIPR